MKNKSAHKYYLNIPATRRDKSKNTTRIVIRRIAVITIFVCGLLLYGCSNQVKDLRSSGHMEPLAESQLIELSLISSKCILMPAIPTIHFPKDCTPYMMLYRIVA